MFLPGTKQLSKGHSTGYPETNRTRRNIRGQIVRKGCWNTPRLVSHSALEETMSGFDPNSQKSFAELRDGIDRTIMLHCWAQISECPVYGCDSELLFDQQTDSDRFVEIEDCELCNAVLQDVAGHIRPGER